MSPPAGRRLALAAPPWPHYTREQEVLARPEWQLPPTLQDGCRAGRASRPPVRPASLDSAGAYAIPNVVHQPWLHGGTLKWEHILGMLSVRYVLRPRRYMLYYDKAPASTPTWRCACLLAVCVQRRATSRVPGRPGLRLRMYHWPDVMRLELLHQYGGIFVDHDAFVVRPLDDLRACAAAPVLAGFEQCSATLRKLNPGVLLAARRAPFLGLCLASWANYSTAWDDNCCARSYVIHSDHPGLAQVRADLGPLPRYRTKEEYHEHLSRTRVLHTTALSHRWRRQELRAAGVLRAVRDIVIRHVNASRPTPEAMACAASASEAIDRAF